MRKQAAAASGVRAGPANAIPARRTPHRPVVSLALAIFLPAVWLVLNGNLSVQTALVRFIGALLVSWCAAWLVVTTTHHSAGSTASHKGGGATPASPEPDGTTELAGEVDATQPEDPGGAAVP